MLVNEDVVEVKWLIAQIEFMERARRTLVATSAGTNNQIGISYDAGYLSCLTEMRDIILHPDLANISDKEMEEKETEETPKYVDEDEDEDDYE